MDYEKHPIHVLIIEDNTDDAFLIQRELTRGGFDVSTQRVDTYEGVRSALGEKPWDVIISDYNLPGFDGIKALNLYNSFHVDTPFLLISGAVGEETAVQAMKAGAHDYIKKDNLSRLVPAVQRELREVQIRKERLEAMEMLDASETRFRALVENIPIGVCRIRLDDPARFVMANPSFMKIFGLGSTGKLKILTLADLFANPQDLQRFSDILLKDDHLTSKEWLFKKNDGTPIWGMVTAQIGKKTQNGEVYFDCTIEDITSRRQAQKLQDALYQIAQATNTTQTLSELISQIHQIINGLMNANNFYLALIDESENKLTFPYLADQIDQDSTPISFGKGMTSLVINRGESMLITHDDYLSLVDQELIDPVGVPAVDWLGVPLKTRENKTIGALVVQTYDDGVRITEDDLHILNFVSSHVALAVEHRQSERRMEDQQKLLRQVIDVNPNFIYAKDILGRLSLVNQAFAAAYDTSVESLIGKQEIDFIPNKDEAVGFQDDDIEVIQTNQGKFIEEEVRTDAFGNVRRMQTVKLPLLKPGEREVQVLGVSTDITYTFQDSLTKLPNRRVFLDRLNRVLKRSHRQKNAYNAVLMLDLDRFALVNESYGHSVGDELLIKTAHRLILCLRNVDSIARFGGDEFAILVEDLESVNSITQIADRILEEMSAPFILEDQQIIVSTSIGIVLCSPDYQPENILRDADVALNRAKAAGKNRYELFHETMRESVREKLKLETNLRQAISRQELELHFEPILNLETGKVISLEVLLRWRNPRRGLIYPGHFIPLAEETGLIKDIGEWVLTESCRLLSKWHKKYPSSKHTAISVNLSTVQFEENLVEKITNILKKTNLDPKYLELEITESVIIKNESLVISALEQFRKMGVKVKLDDFGTGYSSLVYLHRLPLQAIKIDRSFISGSGSHIQGLEIVRTIIHLAKDLQLETIAEGVETQEQLMLLRGMGCTDVQGFLFTQTMTEQDTERFFRDQNGQLNWSG